MRKIRIAFFTGFVCIVMGCFGGIGYQIYQFQNLLNEYTVVSCKENVLKDQNGQPMLDEQTLQPKTVYKLALKNGKTYDSAVKMKSGTLYQDESNVIGKAKEQALIKGAVLGAVALCFIVLAALIPVGKED